jgi:hypothetical protein
MMSVRILKIRFLNDVGPSACGLLRDHESDRVAHPNHPSGSFVFAPHSKVPRVTLKTCKSKGASPLDKG